MQNNVIRVLIADDKRESCEMISRYLEGVSDIEICGLAYDGEEALEKIYSLQPEVVLLDVMMPKLDGIAVLRRLGERSLDVSPRIVMLTGANNEFITNEAFSLGACYYLMKPTNFENLKETIYFVSSMDMRLLRNNRVKEDKSVVIRRILLNLQIPTHLIGYNYIVEAILIMLSGGYLGNLTKQVYNRIAIENRTNADCVESAIRSAIREVSNKNTPTFQRIFSDVENGRTNRPSNLKFLTKLKEEIRLYYNE